MHLTGLDPDTTYFFRVSSTDGAGNTAVDPAPPATDTFTTPNGVAIDTTFADFGAGTTGGSTYVSNIAGGEVILAPVVGAEFEGTGLPSGWTTGSWTGGSDHRPGGEATVDGSWLRADGLVGAGRAVEFVGHLQRRLVPERRVRRRPWTASGESWAMFGTNATSGVLQARTSTAAARSSTCRSARSTSGPSTRYRIEWDTAVRFYIDGALVHTARPPSAARCGPIASDYNTGGGALSIDWMRMTPYASPGTFISRVHDAGNPAGGARCPTSRTSQRHDAGAERPYRPHAGARRGLDRLRAHRLG